MCGSLKAKKQSCSKNLITMENARLMCGIWLPSAITLTCSGCSDLRRTLSRQFVFLSQDWKVFFSPCRSASLCSFPLILCTGVSVPERRVEKTDICLTKSSGEATLSDPLPNSLRPYPFGHLPHTLPLALTVCTRACTRQREESLPTMLCIFPPPPGPFSLSLPRPCFTSLSCCCWGQTGTGRLCCEHKSVCEGGREGGKRYCFAVKHFGHNARSSRGSPFCFTLDEMYRRTLELQTTCKHCCADWLASRSLHMLLKSLNTHSCVIDWKD